MKIPDFFIVGAPKCGTTSLARWIGAHPDVFIPPVKEPHFFCFDSPRYRQIDSIYIYTGLYKAAGRRLCCDASTSYLFSNVAIPAIMACNPAAKIIAMVRNPLKMLPSLHAQKLYSMEETEPDFATAWRLSPSRAKGEMIPPGCRAPHHLDYRSSGRLGKHMRRLKLYVPDDQLHVIVFDDMQADPSMVYSRALDFLALDQGFQPEFKVANQRKQHWSHTLAALMDSTPMRRIKRAAKQHLPGPTTAVGRMFHGFNSRPAARQPLSPSMTYELATEFEKDVNLLGGLIGRDLHHWLCEGR